MTTTHGADRPNEAEPVMARIGEAIALGQQRHRASGPPGFLRDLGRRAAAFLADDPYGAMMRGLDGLAERLWA